MINNLYLLTALTAICTCLLSYVCPSQNVNIGDLPLCESQAKTQDFSRLVFVSTLDGKISALNLEDGGNERWSISTGPGPMLSSSIHSLELTNNGQWVRMIPSLNGGLYKFNGKSIEVVPVTADHLLQSSFKYSDELVISGGKESRTYGVEVSSGRVLYECNMNKCENTTFDDGTPIGDIMLVQRQTQTVRAIEPRSGIERWNFSVGQHDVKMAPDPDNRCQRDIDDLSSDIILKAIVPDGLVCAISKSKPGVVIWQHKFEFPVVSAWKIVKGQLVMVDLFGGIPGAELPDSPLLYVGMHNKQLYIQESVILQKKISEQSLRHHLITDQKKLPSIPWKPVAATPGLLGITGISEPRLLITDESESSQASTTALSVLYGSEYVNGNGYFIYPEPPSKGPECPSDSKVNITLPARSGEAIDDDGVIIEEATEDSAAVQIIIVSLWYWWKEVALISITTAVLLNFGISVRRNRRTSRRESGSSNSSNPTEMTSLPPSIPSSVASLTLPPSQEYTSRYLTDFEPLYCLGQGGFGVVFQAKNKIDDCHYAIKRIPLPNKQESREKVMREVKALAKLDHHNIVRYFNAWLECPPPDWQENQDALWLKKHPEDQPSEVCIDLSGQVTPSVEMSPSIATQDTSNFTNNNFDEASDSFIVFQPPSKDRVSDSFIQFEYSHSKPQMTSIEEAGTWDKDEDKVTESSPLRRPNSLNLKSSRMFLFIQMQLCKKESLQDWLKTNTDCRDLCEILSIFNQIVHAVEYVHLRGLIHRDLKPSNIFFSPEGQIKVGDFGLVTAMAEDCEEFRSPLVSRKFTDGLHTAQVGTKLYMSPEQLSGKQYNYKVDVYSLGVILFELLVPFQTQMERCKCLQDVRNHKFPPKFSKSYPFECELLKVMLSSDPERRPTTIGVRCRPPLRELQLEATLSDDWHYDLPSRLRSKSDSS